MDHNWAPFSVVRDSKLPPRAVTTLEGVGDRMRAAAFAELQAMIAFGWAAEHFTDAPLELRAKWRELVIDEERHYHAIMNRMKELNIDPAGRPVSDRLWVSLEACTSAHGFTHFITNSEERGRQAGLRFAKDIEKSDPTTANIFKTIAEEEVDHVALAQKYYPTAQT